ncbi:hypothetical protein F5884DRAFT_850219 [Xylogone sp. PMI_703]|nr:hypothetical protein F5884DRAFT_850219 [Xylogone sp. PMI_703]
MANMKMMVTTEMMFTTKMVTAMMMALAMKIVMNAYSLSTPSTLADVQPPFVNTPPPGVVSVQSPPPTDVVSPEPLLPPDVVSVQLPPPVNSLASSHSLPSADNLCYGQ